MLAVIYGRHVPDRGTLLDIPLEVRSADCVGLFDVAKLRAQVDTDNLAPFMTHFTANDESYLMILLSLLCRERLGDWPTSSR